VYANLTSRFASVSFIGVFWRLALIYSKLVNRISTAVPQFPILSMDISPYRSLSIACACAEFRRANRAVTHLYDLVLAPVGIKATQFMALKSICEAGEIAQCNYAREYGVSTDTLSRRLGSLRRKGLVEMRRGGHHSERLYRITDSGRELLIEAMPYWERAQYRLRTKLGEKHWQVLFQVCESASRAAKEAEQFRARNNLRFSPPSTPSELKSELPTH